MTSMRCVALMAGRVVAAAAAATTATATAAAASMPSAGDYAAQLCVTTQAAAAPSCGPADVTWRAGGRARVRIDDIVYHLALRSSQLDVVLMHGTVQIDEFSADFDWDGAALQFRDAERGARYVLRLGERRHAAK